MRALVLDDSRAMRTLLGRILGELGFGVLEAGEGGEALDLLHAHPEVDLVLVDWNLPGMSGLEVVRTIRSKPHLARVRLLMVTTETELGRMSQALEAGADEYIMKPFSKEMLVDKLNLMGVYAP